MAPGRKAPESHVVHTPKEPVKGGRKAPRSRPEVPVSVRVQNKDPFTGTEHYKEDVRGKKYPSIEQEDWEYLTTWEIADAVRTNTETVLRWCRNWFGKLPPGRSGGTRKGYRIPLEYLYVGRAWKQIEEPRIRELVRWALVDDLKDYVVLCGNVVSCHYTSGEVMDRLQQLFDNPMLSKQLTTVIYVGPIQRLADGSLKPYEKKRLGAPKTRARSVGVRVIPSKPHS